MAAGLEDLFGTAKTAVPDNPPEQSSEDAALQYLVSESRKYKRAYWVSAA